MRKIALASGIVAALIVLVLAAAWLFIDPNQYRGLIQAQLEQQLARKVTLGKMSLGLLPLRFQVQDVNFCRRAPLGRSSGIQLHGIGNQSE